MQEKKHIQLGIRMSKEMYEQIKAVADEQQRSMSQVVKMAVEKYLEPKGHTL